MSTRINASLMPQFVAKNVRLVGEVTQRAGTQWTLQSCDQVQVTVEFGATGVPGADAVDSKYFELVGRCDGHRLTLDDPAQHAAIPLGNTLDVSLVKWANNLWNNPKLANCFHALAAGGDNAVL